MGKLREERQSLGVPLGTGNPGGYVSQSGQSAALADPSCLGHSAPDRVPIPGHPQSLGCPHPGVPSHAHLC